jgi:hypothetical protein
MGLVAQAIGGGTSIATTSGINTTGATLLVCVVQDYYSPSNIAAYNAGTTYSSGTNVKYNGLRYYSLQNSNTGNTPSTSPTWWKTSLSDNQNNTWTLLDDYDAGSGFQGVIYYCVSPTTNSSHTVTYHDANGGGAYPIVSFSAWQNVGTVESGSWQQNSVVNTPTTSITVPPVWTLTGATAGSPSAGDTSYAGTINESVSNCLVGNNVLIAGFANAGNNGTFPVIGSSSGTLQTTNAGGVNETLSATAQIQVAPATPTDLVITYVAQYTNAGAGVTATVPTGFTSLNSGSNNIGGSTYLHLYVAYQLVTSTAVQTPTWNLSSNAVTMNAGMAVFQTAKHIVNYGNVVAGSYSLPAGVNSTYFYARWTGLLVPTVSGLYTVGLNYSDGANLFVGDIGIVTDLSGAEVANSSLAYVNSQTIELQAGTYYEVVVEWQHGGGGSYECQLAWTPPGGSIQLIPLANLTDSSQSLTYQIDGAWWNGSSGVWYPTGHGIIDMKSTNMANPSSSTILNKQGNIPSTGVNTFSYASTTTSITVTWGAFSVLNPDGSTISVPANSGGTVFSGLTSSSTYYFGAYVDTATGTCHAVLSDQSSGKALFSPAYITQTINGDGNIGINWNIAAATPGAGTGGGSGGGGGVGGCFTDQGVQTPEGFVKFSEMNGGPIYIKNETGVYPARRIVHDEFHEIMLDMGDGKLVTMGHVIKNAEGKDVPAIDVFPNAPRVEFTGTVYNMEVLGPDHHYILENGVIAHNYKLA